MTVADASSAGMMTRLTPEASSWTADSYAALLNGGHGFGFVAEQLSADGEYPSRMIGFLVGRVVSDEAEILNLAVEHSERRRGTGSALVAGAIKLLAGKGVQRLFLEVRESNEGARTLYQNLGFQGLGRRKAYYRDPVEDAIVLEKVIVR